MAHFVFKRSRRARFAVQTDEQKAAKAAEKARKESEALTCQCCGRRIHAATGTIAHHGYQRPGDGWQTASCMGARCLPFETDRTVLGVMIKGLENRLQSLIKVKRQVAREAIPIKRLYKEPLPSKKDIEFTFTRETFDTVRKEVSAKTHSSVYQYSWEDFKKAELASRQNKIDGLADYIAQQQRRYDGWTQTKVWETGTWVDA